MKRFVFCALAASLMLAGGAVTQVDAHDGEGGEPPHMGTTSDDDLSHWHKHPTAVEREALEAERKALRQRHCDGKKADMRRAAEEWNRREEKAWARLQEACADQTPVGEQTCKNRTRFYQANYTPAHAAAFREGWEAIVAEACGPPKSREQLECEALARIIRGERSRRNENGVAYWTQRSTEAGCT